MISQRDLIQQERLHMDLEAMQEARDITMGLLDRLPIKFQSKLSMCLST
jgi:hypothetical protein